MSAEEISNTAFPLLPLRDVVVYPQIVQPLFVGRPKSIKALEVAMASDKQVLLVAQKSATDDEPGAEDLYNIGTVATILQLIRLPDGTVKVLVEGLDRAKIKEISFESDYFRAETSILFTEEASEKEAKLLLRSLLSQFDQYVQLSKKIPPEVMTSISSIDEPARLVDTIASHMTLQLQEKQNLLELSSLQPRIEHLMSLIEAEIDLFQVEKRIRGRVKKQMEKSQREYYLNEQMKAIQKEMGEMDDVPNEAEELKQKIEEAGMPKEAKEKASSELSKLKLMSPMSSEASVVRTYLDWMISIPWKKRSKVRLDLAKAEEILESDHYGLKEVKERILEYLAVQKRVKKLKGPILCLVGPPGVGKTSLGESIARATNRKYVRMALGGVRDEAEIRGHRRTYIGSLPGKLLQKLSKIGVKNPLFLLDEIDKMGMDNRGDPASALLEVLDPEQNNSFNDHYLEVDYDLSEVMFVCTSNSMNIPGPLLDRMEVIRIPGYTEDEKLNIAQRYLVPKQKKNNGVADEELQFSEQSIRDMIRYYTREAGVRGLEREIAKVCRKVVKVNSLKKKHDHVDLDSDMLEEYSGVRKYDYGKAEEENRLGQVNGLAWTSVGGELLTIEAIAVEGKGKTIKTGSLGDVMQESIQAAFTVVRSRANSLGLKANFHENVDLHIHVPEGATPKDGPSAGVGMCTALVSVLTSIPVRADVAMTGEITLRGQVLKIGGLKEKLLAAHRGNIKTVLIPADNERDLAEIPDNIKADLKIIPVTWIDEVLEHALQHQPTPISEDEKSSTKKEAKQEDKSKSGDEKHINTH
ncbi:MAG: endopeptidase La [Gammaproteobacteria bacterium]|jgi:ATP-dependent Lon protease|nr:endopeptidase La [Gammaproteobacteria bacterium]MBT3860670.1 endopeptidase La [Gammaproteobacteria bacterium]MBT3988348.1 endopeptidase La [Gammaproteobacteria bacterium]MBT4256379.1 endopeptidase La [Gammaproteobacteria bacterium]MBT4581960.1 endopeptidase La [Gammaproteobacteria bacterium]